MSFEKGNDSRDDLPLKANGKKWNAATAYEPWMCDRLLELGKEGKTFSVCAKEFGVRTSTMIEWRKKFPEWDAAYEMAKDLMQSYWEELIRDNAVYYENKDGPKRVVKDSLILHRLRCYFDVKENNGTTINPDGSVTTTDERAIELTKKYMEGKS